MKIQKNLSRRDFLKASGAMTAFSILPGHVWANSPNERLQVGVIGIGARGKINQTALLDLPNVDIVALCEVDSLLLDKAANSCPKAEKFSDYRVMFEKMGNRMDAVLVSTPDHMHAPISMDAMKLGMHVYTEKPLAHNVVENRELKNMAEQRNLVTQMGIQNSAGIGYRMGVEYIRNGLIGKVKEVHLWSFKEWGSDDASIQSKADPVPANLDWNLWLGVAPKHIYKEGVYHPNNWRKIIDFGTGTLGDMGVHMFDTPYRALELTAPEWIQSICREPNGFSHPSKTIVEYGFPGTKWTSKQLKWVWYDGKNGPPKEIPGLTIPEGRKLESQGCVLIGEKGSLVLPHKSGPQTFPLELIRSVPRPKLSPRNHHAEWVDACLGHGKTNSPFSYGGPLCEALQLGVIASRFPGRKLTWDADTMQVTNIKEANQFLKREYRKY